MRADVTSMDPQADALAMAEGWSRVSGKAMQLMSEFWVRQLNTPFVKEAPAVDPLGLIDTWTKLGTGIMREPEKLAALQAAWFDEGLKLMQGFMAATAQPEPPVIRDKRFAAKDWSENRVADFIRQSYLLASKYVYETVQAVDGLDEATRAKATFYTRQMMDALAPSNFLLTNPHALQTAIDTKGASLLKGLENLLGDLERGRISMTDETAFRVGGNVAVTPGKVIFENRMLQLIQYAATTKQVYETPIVFFPPWINKFYILDLTAEKSMLKWLADQGFTVFIASWKNPDSGYAETTFEDYMVEGQLKAFEVVCEAAGVKSLHAVGYCAAGTLLSATLAYLHAKKKADIIKSATFFTAQVDFSEAGDLGIFVDDTQLAMIDKITKDTGYLDSQYMAQTFNLLRANDLIWSYVVNNYLLGKDPFPFDLLYWNNDATRLPRAMHIYYLTEFYQRNNLVKPGGITLAGVPIDLTKVKTNVYIQAGKEDHIAPAASVYKMTRHFKGPMRFILAGSGHIAGVVNPPFMQKYQYWSNKTLPESFTDFSATATEHKGSWWPDWLAWLEPQSGKKRSARVPGSGPHKAIENAPGRYVQET